MAYLTKGTVEVAQSWLDQQVLDGKEVILPDVRDDSGFQYRAAAGREGLVSVIALPLALRDRVIGVLHIYTAMLLARLDWTTFHQHRLAHADVHSSPFADHPAL